MRFIFLLSVLGLAGANIAQADSPKKLNCGFTTSAGKQFSTSFDIPDPSENPPDQHTYNFQPDPTKFDLLGVRAGLDAQTHLLFVELFEYDSSVRKLIPITETQINVDSNGRIQLSSTGVAPNGITISVECSTK